MADSQQDFDMISKIQLEFHQYCFLTEYFSQRLSNTRCLALVLLKRLSQRIVQGPLRFASQVRVPRDSWPHFTLSDSRLPKPGEPGPRIYIPQEQGGPFIPPGTGFPFRRLLRLACLRWRYSTRPPHTNSHSNVGFQVSALVLTSRHGSRKKHRSSFL
jgi:hypothetical protein